MSRDRGHADRAEDIVVVTGPPGAGKTTVCRLLADSPAPLDAVAAAMTGAGAGTGDVADRGSAPTVHLESDWFFRFLRAGFVAPHLPESQHQNVSVMTIIADTALAYARAGYRVYWDGIVGPWFLDLVLGRLAGGGVGAHYLVLRPPPDVTIGRAGRRDGDRTRSGATTMADRFADLGPMERHIVDASGRPEQVAARCERAVASGRYRLAAEPWTDPGWPVSIKGVVGWHGRFVVLGDRRGGWELPGGRIEAGDPDPETTLRREMGEELGLTDVEVGPVVDTWFKDGPTGRVVIVVYRCWADRPDRFRTGVEHDDVALLRPEELADRSMPERMRRSVELAAAVSRWPDRR